MDARDNEPTTTDAQFQLVLAELKAIAQWQLAKEPAAITLQPTALVNEAYIRLQKKQPLEWNDTHHFIALAARAMQWILIDHARNKKSLRKGGQWSRVEIHEAEGTVTVVPNYMDLHEALAEFEKVDARAFAVIQLCYFGGRTLQEAADHLHLSLSTVKRDLEYAYAWLGARLESL